MPAVCQSSSTPARQLAPESEIAKLTTDLPRLVDITKSTGIHFDHLSSPEQKYIVESMSGGVAIIDYDGDGWPDIFFYECAQREDGPCRKKSP